jgi:hypothetical protein
MKFANVSKGVVIGLALLLASSAFAGTRASLSLTNPTIVNGTELNAGDYKLEWEGSGPNVEVSIMQGKHLVAKVPAKLVDLSKPSQRDAAVINHGEDGSRTLSGARFEGKKYALEIGESSMGLEAGSSK